MYYKKEVTTMQYSKAFPVHACEGDLLMLTGKKPYDIIKRAGVPYYAGAKR
jgi:hypothetical protein